MRSWLNGYDSLENTRGEDYSSDNFIDKAFTSEEQAGIKSTTVVNDDNPDYLTNTRDKVFFLSRKETTKPFYGFTLNYSNDPNRRAKNTDYTKFMGAYTEKSYPYAGNGYWWLRTPPGVYSDYYATAVSCNGSMVGCFHVVRNDHFVVNNNLSAVRPALHLDLSCNIWGNAGTVSTETDNTGDTPEDTRYLQYIICDSYIDKIWGCTSFNLGATAETQLFYESSDPDVAAVTSDGTVTIKGCGNAEITVTAVETARYKSDKIPITISVTKAEQTIACSKAYKKTFAYNTFDIKAKAKTKLTYKSSNTKIATVSATGKVTLKNPGKAYIMITAQASANYKAAATKVTVSSTLKRPTLAAKAMKGQKIKLSWNKVIGASGYKLYVYNPISKKYLCKLTKRANVKSVIHRGLKVNKTYKYKLRAYRIVSGKKVYSAYSESKEAKAKK